jgi:serine/threonine protein kinase
VLRHPHIVATYHFGRQDDTYYIIMEYLEGGSLKDKIQYGVPYPPADAIRLLGQTCEALQFAHSHNVVHRDIKPSNILFDRAGMVKLSDFGIAKLMTAPTITQAGLILGTPEYMSYEQARGQPVVPQSDIYSLGVVAYQLFSGRLPFTNPDMWKILDQHLKDRPRPPRQFNPAIPSAIERAILKALEKDVSKRFRACEEFAQALGYTPSAQVAPVERGPERVQSSVVGAHLVVPETGQAIPISGSDFVIGRITLGGDPSVSRSHARIIVRGNQYWLRDENSTNGTFHNGQRIFDWVLLRPNDTIIFGRLTTRFVIGDNRPRAPARPGAGSKTRMMPG